METSHWPHCLLGVRSVQIPPQTYTLAIERLVFEIAHLIGHAAVWM
jgi:hypothetical protein